MSKPYYEEYAKHALRFYARHPVLKVKGSNLSRSEIENWQVCDDVFKALEDTERELVTAVFRSKGYIADKVYELSCQKHISENYIWRLLAHVTRSFAERRGLR